jgi:hypothetical protein
MGTHARPFWSLWPVLALAGLPLGGFGSAAQAEGHNGDYTGASPSESQPSGAGTRPSESRPSGGGVGFGFSFDLACLLGKCSDAASGGESQDELAKKGPQFPKRYTMSALTVQALVKGGWPMVVDYRLKKGARLRVEVVSKDKEPFVYNLEGKGDRALQIFSLPERFGDEPVVATFAVRAIEPGAGEQKTAPVRLYGLGAGKKAVGSVAIDEVRFGPPSVRISRFGKAQYSFRSRSDFSRVNAEFLLIRDQGGVVEVRERVRQDDIGSVGQGEWVGKDKPKQWDGKDEQGEVSAGLHLLQMRAWRSSVKEGDWVVSWSDDWVDVEP